MIEEDVEELFDIVPKGTKVTIIEDGLPDKVKRIMDQVKLPAYQKKRIRVNDIPGYIKKDCHRQLKRLN